MKTEQLQDRAARYVSGDMSAAERENFELLLMFHEEVRAEVAGLQEAVVAVVMTQVAPSKVPPAALKSRILGTVDAEPRLEPESMVATGPDGLVLWVNPAFTAMCGYSLAELKGRKPGHLLQGPDTDPVTVGRIRESVRARRSCRETLVNYHKDGTRYRVDIRLDAILDDGGQPLYFFAKERKLPEAELARSG